MESDSFGFRLYVLLTLTSVLTTFLFLLVADLNESGQGPSTDRHVRGHNITILLWHWPFGVRQSLQGDVCWDKYQIPGCHLIDQRSFYSSADLVVFHHRELMTGKEKLPLNRPRLGLQKWVWLSLEAPDNSGNLKPFGNLFNWTMSYRRDADITVPYGMLLPQDGEGLAGGNIKEVTEEKTLLACWVVSNYNSKQRRSWVFQSLNRSIPVEVYGHWKRRRLAPGSLLPTITRCYFYLAFENSISKDYITEKLWRNAYQAGAVPVVLGPPPDDYKAVAPPDSFIHIDNFSSMEKLGDFLRQLRLDKERYARYFAWRHNYTVKLYNDWRERLCSICPHYHGLPAEKTYSDLEDWVRR